MLCNFANNLGRARAEPGTLRLRMVPGGTCAMTQALLRDLAEWLAAQAKGIGADDVPAALALPRLTFAGSAGGAGGRGLGPVECNDVPGGA